MRLQIVRDGDWRVLAVCTERGDCDLLDFLDALVGRLAKDGDRLLRLLQRIADEGIPRNTEISHKLAGDVWELIQGDLRLLYFRDRDPVVVCSHALVKRGRKVPRGDIDQAQARCNAYRTAREAGTLEVTGA
jgi:phage-related protein